VRRKEEDLSASAEWRRRSEKEVVLNCVHVADELRRR
jgi:hypothetical protein